MNTEALKQIQEISNRQWANNTVIGMKETISAIEEISKIASAALSATPSKEETARKTSGIVGWVKFSERLPKDINGINNHFRHNGKKVMGNIYEWSDGVLQFEVICSISYSYIVKQQYFDRLEWLDETPIPPTASKEGQRIAEEVLKKYDSKRVSFDNEPPVEMFEESVVKAAMEEYASHFNTDKEVWISVGEKFPEDWEKEVYRYKGTHLIFNKHLVKEAQADEFIMQDGSEVPYWKLEYASQGKGKEPKVSNSTPLQKDGQCSHNWVGYSACCYCGAFDNGKKIIEKRDNASVEALRNAFSEWYFSTSETMRPLAMQIFYWFENNAALTAAPSGEQPSSGKMYTRKNVLQYHTILLAEGIAEATDYLNSIK